MGKLKRVKELAKKIKNALQKAVKGVATWTIKNAPKIMDILVKMIGVADRTGIRKLLINLIPEAGPYINIVIDYLLEAQRLGIVNQVCDILQHALNKDISIEEFINKVKQLFNTAKQSITNSFNEFRNIRNNKPKQIERREELNDKLVRNPYGLIGGKPLEREEIYEEFEEEPDDTIYRNPIDVFGRSIN